MSKHAQPDPCPFCGSGGLAHVPYPAQMEHPELDLEGALNICVTGDGWYAVQCVGCYAMGPRIKASKVNGCVKAIEAWNRRNLWTNSN